MNVYSSIKKVKSDWDKIKLPLFLKLEFLEIFYTNHPRITHLFVKDEQVRMYAHIFKINFSKTKKYRGAYSISGWLLRIIHFDVLYLTNSFITNVPAFVNHGKIKLNGLLTKITTKFSLLVIPDFLYDKLILEDKQFIKIEVEEEMVLNIRENWKTIEQYISDLKRKYRNKVKNILTQTNSIIIRNLDTNEISHYTNELQVLFDQVAESSNFKGPKFNTASYSSLVEKGFMRVDGYFLDHTLVGFSSVMEDDSSLYSYYVGFDKKLNANFPIYGRILLENIASSIKLKKGKLILGRTANEFKSNFGAYPIQSFVYLQIQNRLLRLILTPFLKKVFIKPWIQRRPFLDH